MNKTVLGNFPHLFGLVRAVINETLRLFTPLPASIRDSRDEASIFPRSDATYDLPPMYFPPRVAIVFTFYLMQRNKALWGPDAEEFKPERWFDKELQRKVAANPAIYIPFSSGSRNVSDPNILFQSHVLHWSARKLNKSTVHWQELCVERVYVLHSPSAPALRRVRGR